MAYKKMRAHKRRPIVRQFVFLSVFDHQGYAILSLEKCAWVSLSLVRMCQVLL